VVKVRGEQPETRDEHTACFYESETSMILFGGFMRGVRTNELDKFLFQENRWVKVNVPATSPRPSPRSGHASVIY
jgi:hypothetical protein